MSVPASIEELSRRLTQAWRERAVGLKAVSFALIGVINTLVDAFVFFIGYTFLLSRPDAVDLLRTVIDVCHCGTIANATLIAANILSWMVAITGSYVMNSYVTFAAESGGQLRLGAYAVYLASGMLGLVANTATLVIVAQYLPVFVAKGCAILASFLVNFSMSNFVVFRRRSETTGS